MRCGQEVWTREVDGTSIVDKGEWTGRSIVNRGSVDGNSTDQRAPRMQGRMDGEVHYGQEILDGEGDLRDVK